MKHKMTHHVEPAENTAPPAAEATAAPALAACQKKLTMQDDQYLRLAADFENFRKRTARETGQRSAEAKTEFIHALLPLLDNLERALASDPLTPASALHVGVELTLRQMHALLQQHGIAPGADLGQTFDPNKHEALAVRHDPTLPDHSILDVVQRGYYCGDHAFRPARVVVNDWSRAAGVADAG